MSLGLHKKCLESLSARIAGRLPEIEVKNRMFLEDWTVMLRTAGKILPQNGEFKNKVEQYVSEAEKIILASQWLFDSYCGNNELLSFVQTTVVLEILLGDKTSSDAVGLQRLLSNRCAYLIGDGQKQREELLEQFEKIYEVRSRIVHRGKSRLTGDERELFSTLQWMCRRVIQEEVDLLQKDVTNAQTESLGRSLRLAARKKLIPKS